MNVRVPKEYSSLSAASQRKILEYHEECYNRDIRIILDLYMKMICVTLHDNFEGWNEEQLTLLMGHHRALFFDQKKKVAAGEQLEYLNKRMAEIFPKNGFPQGFFDKMLGSVESPSDERNGMRVLNDSSVYCQPPRVTEPQREGVESLSDGREG